MSLGRLIDVAAATLLLVQVTRMLLGAARLRRQGAPQPAVNATLTANIIGLIATLSAAIGTGYALSRVLTPVALNQMAQTVIQITASLAASWAVAGVYYKWLAGPIQGWFTAEEEVGHGR